MIAVADTAFIESIVLNPNKFVLFFTNPRVLLAIYTPAGVSLLGPAPKNIHATQKYTFVFKLSFVKT